LSEEKRPQQRRQQWNPPRRTSGSCRFYEEIDKGNVDVIDELVAEDYMDHNPPPFPGLASGREGMKQVFKIFWDATPGHHEIKDQIAEADRVVTRLTSHGKHEGDLPGAPRTGNDLKMTSITIHRIADGKLVEKRSGKGCQGISKADRSHAEPATTHLESPRPITNQRHA
jgi:predicted ester cyclase